MNLIVDALPPRPAPRVEVVERKGLGHPDAICDALAEQAGLALCRAYLDKFGEVMHYNVDKALLVGGAAHAAFGAGEILAPMDVILAGRVTRGGLDVESIVEETCRQWLRATLPAVEPHLRLECRFREGSRELSRLYARPGRSRARANDTSAGVGFAPLTPLERAVLAIESALTARETRVQRPWMGPDVKVMGVRSGDGVRLTVACAMVGRHLANLDEYISRREQLRSWVGALAADVLGRRPEVAVNAADGADAGSVYLTVTGTSAESGDDGEVGRGNRTNGLITPLRPMSMEAWAGKNGVSHVGRLYNLAAAEVASDVVQQLGALDVTCALVGEIGRPVDDPALAWVSLTSRSPIGEAAVRDVVLGRLAGLVNQPIV